MNASEHSLPVIMHSGLRLGDIYLALNEKGKAIAAGMSTSRQTLSFGLILCRLLCIRRAGRS